jgi:hypothetical protein
MKTINILLMSMIGCSTYLALAQNQYKFRDTNVPDIATPQPQAQVVSPLVYAQLGSQDRALENLENEIGDVKKGIKSLQDDMKPLQETNIQVRLVLRVLGWLLGFLLASGLGAWLVHKLQERTKPNKPIQTGSLGT